MNKLFKLSFCAALMCGLVACSESPSAQQTTAVETAPSAPNAVVFEEKPAEYISPLPDDAPVVQAVVTGFDEPFSFRDTYGNVSGLEVDIIRAIGEEEGFKVDLDTQPRKELLDAVEAGRYDVGIAFMANTPERQQRFSLTDSYLYAPNTVAYIDESLNIKDINSLDGLSVGVISGGYHQDQATKIAGIKEIVPVDTSFLLYSGLMQGKYQAVIDDATAIKYLANKHDADKKIFFAPYLEGENPEDDMVVMAVTKGNTELVNKINSGIKTLEANGKLAQIKEKWLGENNQ